MTEEWLYGWPKFNSTILMGTGVHCIGCGKAIGMMSVAIDPNWKQPDKEPDWPFEMESCPICELKTEIQKGPEDKLTARLLALKEKRRTP